MISGELRPAAASVGVSQLAFDDNDEEEVEIMMDKGSLGKCAHLASLVGNE